MQRLSKGFFLSSPIVGIVCVFIFGIALLAVFLGSSLRDIGPGVVVVLVLAALGVTYAGIVNLVFIYKMWDAIADEHARTTAGKAVGFLFIPFFGFYWIFQVLWGFAKDCNAYIGRHFIHAKKLPEGLFLACAILQVASFIPYVSVPFALPSLILFASVLFALPSLMLFAILVSKTCDAVNAFRDGRTATFSLYFLSGEFANDSLDLASSGLTMGRDPAKANLVFKSPKISSAHVKLTPTGGGQVLVEDLNSLNGTFYRHQQASPQIVSWDWVQLRGQMLFDPGARLRLADGLSEFEIRKQ